MKAVPKRVGVAAAAQPGRWAVRMGVHYRSSTLEALQRLSSRHRRDVQAACVCGCFYCVTTFSPTEISEWVDERDAVSSTALCPNCGIDSVIPEQPDRPLNDEILAAMHAYWF